MMCDKQLLQVLEGLGKNSRRSLAASEVSENKSKDNDTKCAKTIRDIITSNYGLGTNTNTKSLAASTPTSRAAAIPSPNRSPNVNRAKVLYDFMIKNHNL